MYDDSEGEYDDEFEEEDFISSNAINRNSTANGSKRLSMHPPPHPHNHSIHPSHRRHNSDVRASSYHERYHTSMTNDPDAINLNADLLLNRSSIANSSESSFASYTNDEHKDHHAYEDSRPNNDMYRAVMHLCIHIAAQFDPAIVNEVLLYLYDHAYEWQLIPDSESESHSEVSHVDPNWNYSEYKQNSNRSRCDVMNIRAMGVGDDHAGEECSERSNCDPYHDGFTCASQLRWPSLSSVNRFGFHSSHDRASSSRTDTCLLAFRQRQLKVLNLAETNVKLRAEAKTAHLLHLQQQQQQQAKLNAYWQFRSLESTPQLSCPSSSSSSSSSQNVPPKLHDKELISKVCTMSTEAIANPDNQLHSATETSENEKNFLIVLGVLTNLSNWNYAHT